MSTHSKELLFATVTGCLAVISIFAMPWLVAKPKVLFGRSLTAIAPSLFPYVALSLTAAFSVLLMLITWRAIKNKNTGVEQVTEASETGDSDKSTPNDWLSKAYFFILLTAYGLLLKPIGFLVSSALAIALTSVMLGNRNWLQIALLSILAPICLYLIATRGMLVSLPELNAIELFYAQSISQFKSVIKP